MSAKRWNILGEIIAYLSTKTYWRLPGSPSPMVLLPGLLALLEKT